MEWMKDRVSPWTVPGISSDWGINVPGICVSERGIQLLRLPTCGDFRKVAEIYPINCNACCSKEMIEIFADKLCSFMQQGPIGNTSSWVQFTNFDPVLHLLTHICDPKTQNSLKVHRNDNQFSRRYLNHSTGMTTNFPNDIWITALQHFNLIGMTAYLSLAI